MNSISDFPTKINPIVTSVDPLTYPYPATASHKRGCQGTGDFVSVWKIGGGLGLYQCRDCESSFALKPEDFIPRRVLIWNRPEAEESEIA